MRASNSTTFHASPSLTSDSWTGDFQQDEFLDFPAKMPALKAFQDHIILCSRSVHSFCLFPSENENLAAPPLYFFGIYTYAVFFLSFPRSKSQPCSKNPEPPTCSAFQSLSVPKLKPCRPSMSNPWTEFPEICSICTRLNSKR